MKLGKIEGEPYYRMNTPRWASSPTSGAGSAKNGGRFNRRSIPALYLSSEMETAIAEYKQEDIILRPGTLVQYEVSIEPVVMLNFYEREGWDPLWADWSLEWRPLVLQGIEPPTWVMGDIAMEAGAKGIIFPSTKRSGGLNLAIFVKLLGSDDLLRAIDPQGDLSFSSP